MRTLAVRILMVALLGALALVIVRPAPADLADVYLKSGLRLRGDVTRTGDEVIVRNLAGELRIAAADVERIVPVERPSPESSPAAPHTQPAGPPPAGPPPATTPTTAPLPLPTPPATLPTIPPAEPVPPASAPAAPGEMPPAPPISDLDITRLKLSELRLDGPPEDLRVRFLRKGKQRELEREVIDEFRQSERSLELQQQAQEVLTRGTPAERLRFIVRHTGLAHADRIELPQDPEIFQTFRRRVLPLVNRGCARSGCHAGRSARLFRFPAGSPTSDTYAYTTFVLLDQMLTAHGPLLDRTNPEDSVLLDYLMPLETSPRPHPPVGKGPSFRPLIRNPDDPLYQTVLGWINDLVVPRPDYRLDYQNPYAGRLAPQPGGPTPAETPQEGAEPAPTDALQALGRPPLQTP